MSNVWQGKIGGARKAEHPTLNVRRPATERRTSNAERRTLNCPLTLPGRGQWMLKAMLKAAWAEVFGPRSLFRSLPRASTGEREIGKGTTIEGHGFDGSFGEGGD